jgi:uncharacterized protein YmfQ (DUF2313 family)
MARDPGRHTVTLTPSESGLRERVAAPWDGLAEPASDDLIGAASALWPQGAAWGTPDGQALSDTSLLSRFTRVLIDPMLSLYGRAWRLARNATISGVDELIDEWERDYGLPDDCETEAQTLARRIYWLQAKVMSQAAITPGDFVRVAREFGFEVAIEEPCMFECGFSECGGEHELGDVMEEVYFIVRVRDLQVTYFRVSESECGFDPLFEYGAAATLLCIIRKIAPAWTIPILGEWRYFGELDDYSGPMLSGASGFRLS